MKAEDKNIDKFANQRTWKIVCTSNDGIVVTEDKVKFGEQEYTISTTKKYLEQFSASMAIYDKYFK